MTNKRIIYDERAFYHVINRVCGTKYDYLIDDVVKQKFLDIMNHLLELHNGFIEVISYVVMDNHYHLVLAHDPNKELSLSEIQYNYFNYYSHEKDHKVWNDSDYKENHDRMRSLSAFMRELDRRIAVWYNQVYYPQIHGEKRRGHFWQGKFKSTVIDSSVGVRRCIAYVECNPVRANIVKDPADYHFSSFGAYCGTGKHPFETNFTRYYLADKFEDFPTKKELKERFKNCIDFLKEVFVERLEYENNLTENQLHEAMQNHPFETISRRIRYWQDSKIIFCKIKNSEAKESLQEKALNMRKIIHKFKGNADEVFKLFSWHKLFPDDEQTSLEKS